MTYIFQPCEADIMQPEDLQPTLLERVWARLDRWASKKVTPAPESSPAPSNARELYPYTIIAREGQVLTVEFPCWDCQGYGAVCRNSGTDVAEVECPATMRRQVRVIEVKLPLSLNRHTWIATAEGDYAYNRPVGSGHTEDEAVSDLLGEMEERYVTEEL